MTKKAIPDIVVGRLPIYLRALHRMAAEGRGVTSSQELGERLGISAAQIRKDLSQFGEFGKQGTGYTIEFLVEKISDILNVNRVWEVAVVGAGDLGRALVSYSGFNERGFQIAAVFDNAASKVGKKVGNFTVQDTAKMSKTITDNKIKVAMITVPAEHAQAVADELVEAGIEAILNYAPVHLVVPAVVRVQHIDPAIHLQRMTFYLKS